MELILPQPLNIVLKDSCPSLYHSFEMVDVQPPTAAQTAIPPTPAAQRPKPHHEVNGEDKQKAGEVLLLFTAQSKQQGQSSKPCFQGAQPLQSGHLSAFNPAVPSDNPCNLHRRSSNTCMDTQDQPKKKTLCSGFSWILSWWIFL